MSESTGAERSYRYGARAAAAVSTQAWAMTVFLGAVAVAALVTLWGEALWVAMGFALAFGLPAAYFARSAVKVRRLFGSPDRLALGIGPSGLRLHDGSLLAWGNLDLLVIDARVGGYGPLMSQLLRPVLMGVNHVSYSVAVPGAHQYKSGRVAFDNGLEGGRSAYVAMCRDLIAEAANHPNVRVRMVHRFQGWMAKELGNPTPFSVAEEMELGAARGTAQAAAERAAGDSTS